MTQDGMSRRQALRLLGAAPLALAPALLRPDSSSAGRAWCFSDPLFLVGTYALDVSLTAGLEMLKSASGPVSIKLETPKGVPASLLLADLGFGRGYTFSYATGSDLVASKSSIPVRLTVNAPAKSSDIPVSVSMTSVDKRSVVSRNVASGTANSPIVWRGSVDAIVLVESILGR